MKADLKNKSKQGIVSNIRKLTEKLNAAIEVAENNNLIVEISDYKHSLGKCPRFEIRDVYEKIKY